METLYSINDDCQRHILEYISFEDQLSLFEACNEDYTNRFKLNILEIWKSIKTFRVKTVDDFDSKPELKHEILSCISPTLPHLVVMNGYNHEMTRTIYGKLISWKRYNFPKMRSLEWFCQDAEYFIPLLAELFPDLTDITLWGTFHGTLDLTIWKHLQRLNIESWGLDLLKINGLQTLEEITIRDFLDDETFEMLIRLPKLKTLNSDYFSPDWFKILTAIRPKDVEKIFVNCDLTDKIDYLKKFINLRQLTLRDFLSVHNSLKEFSRYFPLLERIDFINCCIKCSMDSFWKTLTTFPSLKIISVCRTQLVSTEKNCNVTSCSLITREYCQKLTAKHSNLKVLFEHPSLFLEHLEQIQFYPMENSEN